MKVPKPPERGRDLQSVYVIDGIQQVNFIDVYVLPDEDSEVDKLGFDYTIEFVDSQTIEIVIVWENPAFVSSIGTDELIIDFNGPFYDTEDGVDIDSNLKQLKKAIPPQAVPGALTDAIEGAGSSLSAASTGAVAGNAAVNIFLAGSLNQLWGMVNNLQLVIHSPLFGVQFPANSFMIFDVMIAIATFDILPTDNFFPAIFPDMPEFEYNFFKADKDFERFDRLQIGSRYTVMNMGTMLIILSFYVLLFIVYPCFNFIKNDSKCGRKYEGKIRSMIFWNHMILFFQEGFLDLLLVAVINL